MRRNTEKVSEDVSIVVVTYNSAKVIARCLESIRVSPETSNAEVVLIDNDSSDSTLSVVNALSAGTIRVIPNTKNKGFAKACNQGVRETTGKYVCFLGPDVFVGRGWLPPLVQVLEDSNVAVVVPRLYWPDGELDAVGAFVKYPPPGVQPLYYRGTQDVEVGLVGFACALFPRGILENFQLDERMFLYNEDIDFCMRVRAAGHKLILCPHSTAIHVGGHSGRNVILQLRTEAYFNRTILKCAPLRLALKGLSMDLVGIAAGIKSRNPWLTYQKVYGFSWTIMNLPILERTKILRSKGEDASLPLVENSFYLRRRKSVNSASAIFPRSPPALSLSSD